MAVEAKRGCGYRKVGGLYMVSGELSAPCGRLPLELHVCPTCHAGIKQARGWTWVKPRELLRDARQCHLIAGTQCAGCPLDPDNLPERAGLLWIGEQFYPTPESFMQEAREQGISRRITAVPRDFKVGETWVLFAHPKAITRAPTPEEIVEEGLATAEQTGSLDFRDVPALVTRKGVITMFRPTAIERIFRESERDSDAVREAEERGLTPVFVPDDDPDHDPPRKNGGNASEEI